MQKLRIITNLPLYTGAKLCTHIFKIRAVWTYHKKIQLAIQRVNTPQLTSALKGERRLNSAMKLVQLGKSLHGMTIVRIELYSR